MSVAAAVVIIAMMAKYKAKTLLGLSVSHNVVPGVWGKGGGGHIRWGMVFFQATTKYIQKNKVLRSLQVNGNEVSTSFFKLLMSHKKNPTVVYSSTKMWQHASSTCYGLYPM